MYNRTDGAAKKPVEPEGCRECSIPQGVRWLAKGWYQSSALYCNISQPSTAAEMCKKLLTVFEFKSETSIHLLQQQLYELKMNDGETIEELISRGPTMLFWKESIVQIHLNTSRLKLKT